MGQELREKQREHLFLYAAVKELKAGVRPILQRTGILLY